MFQNVNYSLVKHQFKETFSLLTCLIKFHCLYGIQFLSLIPFSRHFFIIKQYNRISSIIFSLSSMTNLPQSYLMAGCPWILNICTCAASIYEVQGWWHDRTDFLYLFTILHSYCPEQGSV